MQNTLCTKKSQTLFASFLAAAQQHGWDKKIIEDVNGKHASYRDLLKTIFACGKWSTRFSSEHETVGILLPNLAISVCMIFGLGVMRRVPALLNFATGISGIVTSCEAAQIKFVITSRKFLETIKLQETVNSLKHVQVFYIEDMADQMTFADKLWLMWKMWRPGSAVKHAAAEEPAIVLFTSGSEDKPKGVVLSHKALLFNIAQVRSQIDFSTEDKFFNALPIQHAYGLNSCTLLPLLGGIELFLYISPIHYHAIPDIFYRKNCTCMFGTSAFLGHYATHAHPYHFGKLRYVISGGEKLNEEVRKIWLEKLGLRILEGYGAAECAPVLALNTNLAYKQGAVGKFLADIEYRIEPIPGLAQGGILHVRGPNLMLGYYLYEQPGVLQPPKSLFGPGWHCTGDVVEVDDEGFVTVKGRVKRFAKIAGEMVSLEIVEKIALHASPQYHHVATLISDVRRGEIIVLFTTDPKLNRLTLSHAAKELGQPELAVARQINHIADLPLLAIGKVDYLQLKTMAQQLPPAAPKLV